MNTITLQVPMNKDLRDKAARAAQEQGFSSLQEVVRVLVNKFARGRLAVTVEEPVTQLSAKAAKRYDKMIADMESGKVKTSVAHSADELFKQLGI